MANSTISSTVTNEKQARHVVVSADADEATAGGVPPFKWSHLWEQPIMQVHSTSHARTSRMLTKKMIVILSTLRAIRFRSST